MKLKLDKAGYPLEWLILESVDFCRERFVDKRRCCMAGWLNKTFGADPTESTDTAGRRDMGRRVHEAATEIGAVDSMPHLHAHMNDNKINSLALLARVWNLAGAMAGYVVGNPEAKTLRKIES